MFRRANEAWTVDKNNVSLRVRAMLATIVVVVISLVLIAIALVVFFPLAFLHMCDSATRWACAPSLQ